MDANKVLVASGFSGLLGSTCILVVLASVLYAFPVKSQHPFNRVQDEAASTARSQVVQFYRPPKCGIPGRREGAGTH